MEKCYKYLACMQKNCVMYGREDSINCWEVKETLCNHPGVELIKNVKKNKCEFCIYFKACNSSSK